MQLLLIRHADAGDQDEFFRATGKSDFERPLSPHGIEMMQASAKGLKLLQPQIDRLVTSPLLRARQTGDIVRETYGNSITGKDRELVDALVHHMAPKVFVDWLELKAAANTTMAAVGHEPHLSKLIGWMLYQQPISAVRMTKGGAALLQRQGHGAWQLVWLLDCRALGAME